MTTVEDERIERMRATVMAGVDADVRRRATRMRRTRAVLVAGAFVVVAGGLGVSALNPVTRSIGDDSLSAGSVPDVAREGPAAGDADLAEEVAPDDTDRSVIVTGSAHVVTDDPRRSSADLATWVEGRDGRVDARSLLLRRRIRPRGDLRLLLRLDRLFG